MADIPKSALIKEWATLQNNHEAHERNALLIKIVAIVLFAVGTAWPHGAALHPRAFFAILCFVVCVLWMQEAILRTSQSRLGQRLLRIEALQRDVDNGEPSGSQALQLHSEWQASRAGGFGLLGEYARSALRPTVAFPYALLAALLAVLTLAH